MMDATTGGEEWSIESPWMFRDKKYLVSADVREDVLVLQVEERLTADRWRGQFEPKRECISRHISDELGMQLVSLPKL